MPFFQVRFPHVTIPRLFDLIRCIAYSPQLQEFRNAHDAVLNANFLCGSDEIEDIPLRFFNARFQCRNLPIRAVLQQQRERERFESFSQRPRLL
jgi:hypothetical protein